MTTLYGRDEEFVELLEVWDAVKTGQGPRTIAYIADTGVGKSRLVQQLYHHLAHSAADDPFDYWPDAFLDAGDSLQVTPKLPDGHRPAGPPTFLWLGTRWADPGERNMVDARALPELRDQLAGHARLIRDLATSWRERLAAAAGAAAGKQVRSELQGWALGVLNTLVPFSGLVLPLVVGIAQHMQHASRGIPAETTARVQELREQLRDLLRKLLQGKRPVPVVLWLDDAHWIDGNDMSFVAELRREAAAARWPLLLIVTAWPREWHERRLAALFTGGATADPAVVVRDLHQASDAALAQLARAELPGLSDAQRTLLVQKADGNFLTLRENITELRLEELNFEQSDPLRALSPAGEEQLSGWESNRPRRIAQRFARFDSDMRKFLARAGALGLGGRFIAALVHAYAARRNLPDSQGQLRRSLDEYAVILQRSAQLYEFRDPAYHRAATAFLNTYLKHEQPELERVLDAELAAWVGGGAGDGALARLPAIERAAVLALAQARLGPDTAAGVQARVLRLLQHAEDRQYELVRQEAAAVEGIAWAAIPEDAVSLAQRAAVRDALRDAGALAAAVALAGQIIDARRRTREAAPSLDSQAALAIALSSAGVIRQAQGDLSDALACFEESLALMRAVMAARGTPDDQCALGSALNNVGRIRQAQDDLSGALACFEESVALSRAVVAARGTPQDQRDLGVALHRAGRVREVRGNLAGALACFEESVALLRAVVVARGTNDDQSDLGVTLNRVGGIREVQGDLVGALAYFTEDLVVSRAVVAARGTPQDQRDLGATLNNVGHIREVQGDLAGALACFEESLALSRVVLVARGMPEDQRDLAATLNRVGGIREARGDLSGALACFEESVALSRAVVAARGMSQDQRDLGIALNRLGDIRRAQGNPAGALACFEESVALSRAVVAARGMSQDQRALGYALNRLGGIREAHGDLAGALTCFEESVALSRAVVAARGTPQDQRELAVALNNVDAVRRAQAGSG